MSISNGEGLSLPGSGGGGGASDFTDLLDTPTTYLAAAGYRLVVNGTEDGIEFITDTFLNLSDTPSSYAAQAGKFLKVNAGATALEFVDEPSGVDTFTGLTDTPANFTDDAFKVPAVNSGETALEFVTTLSTDNYAYFRDEKTSGTNGGTASVGDNTRDLNTAITNNIPGCSLASDQVTLAAGDYYVRISAPGFAVDRHRASLYNATDASDVLLGYSGYSGASNQVTVPATVQGTFTLAASKALEVRHYCESQKTNNGLGVQVGDGSVEVYTEIEIWRLT